MDITGTALDDELNGSADADTIKGLGGNDSIDGGDGSDTIDGGDGSDDIRSGYGSDTVQGGEGGDSISDIGDGSDTLIGGAGDDSIRLRHFSWSQPLMETIRIDAGAGNDQVDYSAMHFYLASSKATIDLGAGDDRLTLETDYGDTVRVSLGTGRDTVVLSEYGYSPNSTVISDFTTGAAGDTVDFTAWITERLYGWDGSNPFGSSGYLRLVQAGADTTLEVDGDGPSDSHSSWRPLFRFENTTASAFTADNLGGWRPDGAAPPAVSILGTEFSDSIEGTIGNDTIRGLGESDRIIGGAGDDVIYGGAGNDQIEGGPGSDMLDGGDGDDYISSGGGSDTLIGARGNDILYFATSDVVPSAQIVRIDAGDGDDEVTFANSVYVSAGGYATIDLGDGADRLLLQSAGGPTRVTLGRGRDSVVLSDQILRENPPEFTDFTPGAAGDIFDLTDLLQRIGYWDGSNPFGVSGHARLVQTGADTLLQLDPNGAAVDGSRFMTSAILRNVNATTLTAANFAGFDPRIVSLTEAATVSVTAPSAIAEDGGKALSLTLTFGNVAQMRGTVTMSLATSGSTVTNGADATVPDYTEDYAVPPNTSGTYTFALPSIAILADRLAEGTETLALTVRVSGQMFDTGAETKTVIVKLIDSGQTGGAGADTLTGTRFTDDIAAGGGDDILKGGAGDDRLDGGSGIDTAQFSGVFHQSRVVVGADRVSVTGPDGADTLSGVERLAFADGVFVIDPDSFGAQIARLYDTVLGRAPDAAGLDFWLDQIEDRGATVVTVADNIAGSGEFRAATGGLGNAAFVDYVYAHALGRAPDAGGRAFWAGQLDQGMSRGTLLVNFSETAEHRARTAGVVAQGYFNTDDTAQAVALLYDSFANRLPDAPGLTAWSEAIKSGAYTLAQAAAGFAASPEFAGATRGMGNAQLVDFMYRNTLDREADGGGRAYWTDLLDHGFAKGDLLLAFSQSPEHAALFAPHIIGGIDVLM